MNRTDRPIVVGDVSGAGGPAVAAAALPDVLPHPFVPYSEEKS